MKSYKTITSLDDRKYECEKMMTKYPNLIPLIIESRSKELVLEKRKYLVNSHTTVGALIYTILKMLKIQEANASIFLHIDNTLIATSSSFGNLYKQYKDEDGFLYCFVSKENTYG
jgi:hypothetical protein